MPKPIPERSPSLPVALAKVGGWPHWPFRKGTGLKFNIIPQPGTAAFAVAQLAGGHTDLAILAPAATKGQIEGGLIRFLAVFGSKKAPGYENVPTLKEEGYEVNWESTQRLIGPPEVAATIVANLVNAFENAANEPEYKKFVTNDREADESPMSTPELAREYPLIITTGGRVSIHRECPVGLPVMPGKEEGITARPGR